MRKAILVSLVNILAFFVAANLFSGISVHNPLALFWAGILLGIINLLIRPLLLLLTLPINLLTLGLTILVVNTWMIMLTAAFVPGMQIHGFITAFLTSLVVSAANWLLRKVSNHNSST